MAPFSDPRKSPARHKDEISRGSPLLNPELGARAIKSYGTGITMRAGIGKPRLLRLLNTTTKGVDDAYDFTRQDYRALIFTGIL